jgi:PAS domain S-box-containing protein
MKRHSEDLVRFVSRAFLAASIAIIVGLGVLLALFYQRSRDSWWAQRSREVSRLAREVDILALRRQSALQSAIAVGAGRADFLDSVVSKAKLDSLRQLSIEVPVQRERAERIIAGFARWDSTMANRRAPIDREILTATSPIFTAIGAETRAFLAAEEVRYHDRVRAARRLDRAFAIAFGSAVLVMLVTLHLMRRRLLSQAHEQSIAAAALDLRNAQLIHQTRQMEEALDDLQASETRFRTLVQSMHDVIFTMGTDTRYTGMFGGASAERLDAYAQYVGKTATEILGPEVGKTHMDAAARALAGETVEYEWQMSQGDITRQYAVTVSPLRGPNGDIRGVVGVNRDVTEQHAREKALADAREQLRQAQRLEALGQLAGGVAHDFNNLLTVIMTYAAILQEEAAAESDTFKSIDEIRIASERAAALTRQLLAFGRRQMLQPRTIDLNETVRDVERMLRRLLPPDIVFETTLASSPSLVTADPGQIEQVLINLAINARDAMPEGGRLTVTTANIDRDDNAPLPGPHVLITVRDTGVGIPPETMAKIFEPFFTTKAVGKGTGLGLATVHGIIEQSGGRVTVESQVGRGTTFFIRLPKHVAQLAEAPAKPSVSEAIGGSETILLVDDNEELRRVVKRMLVRAGYEVIEASSGGSALAQLDRGARVHVVLTDVMMPDMSGRAVLEAVSQRHGGVRVLLMSGYNYDTALRGMAQRGDVSFIEKPFTSDALLRKLREVLAHTGDRGVA